MSICAVIPAAGRGTRLGGSGPKILTPLTAQDTIWSILYAKLSPLVDHIHLVLSPEGAAASPPLSAKVSTSVQPAPTGMGDAIFRGYDVWSKYDAVLVVWGDQVFVSEDTLKRAIATLGAPRHHAVLPVTRMAQPYVEYVFEDRRLTQVLQTREGDTTTPNGFSDVGTFLLGTDGLKEVWENYLTAAPRGAGTGEINFLPFLPFLSGKDWAITPVEVADETEARGINTKEDLAFFRRLYREAP
jgi:bifunctional N-acetylglucosamine-1-phosphate-uridyltransferase/glucosamine-1-phosphate-acetyltransferase GlmU-like protein